MDALDPHRPRSLVAIEHKEVLLIRHGQSLSNAAGAEAEADHQSARWLDAPITALGQAQATSWSGVAHTWNVEEVWCSPLTRAMETACRIFEHCDIPIHVTPYAREGWWHCTENRGRILAHIEAGTDGQSDEQRWPKLSELPGSHKLRGLAAIAQPIPQFWDPSGESAEHANEEKLFDLWRASLAELKKQLLASKARRIALVCHWGVIEALTGVDCQNCTLVPTVAREAEAGSGLMCSVCPPIVAHPPLGIRGFEHHPNAQPLLPTSPQYPDVGPTQAALPAASNGKAEAASATT